MWEWITNTFNWSVAHWSEILVVFGIIERIAKETDEDFTLFGLKIGKYDNQITDKIKEIGGIVWKVFKGGKD